MPTATNNRRVTRSVVSGASVVESVDIFIKPGRGCAELRSCPDVIRRGTSNLGFQNPSWNDQPQSLLCGPTGQQWPDIHSFLRRSYSSTAASQTATAALAIISIVCREGFSGTSFR